MVKLSWHCAPSAPEATRSWPGAAPRCPREKPQGCVSGSGQGSRF